MADTKSLQRDSKYNKYDIDGDGVVNDAEMQKMEHMIEFENKDKKEDQLRQMAWMAMGSMVLFTGVLFSPLVSIEKLTALGAVLQMFYLAQAGVVATFFGSQAYVSTNSNT
jgi:hypothetical protein